MTTQKKFTVSVGGYEVINIVTDFEISAGVSKIMLIKSIAEESATEESVNHESDL